VRVLGRSYHSEVGRCKFHGVEEARRGGSEARGVRVRGVGVGEDIWRFGAKEARGGLRRGGRSRQGST